MENTISKQRIAVRAVIIKDGKILLIRESMAYEGGVNKGKYDFPGGKVEMGEFFLDSIKREVSEEVGIEVEVGKPFHVGEWRPVIKGEQIQIIGMFFLCKPLSDKVVLSNDHDDYIFISPEEAHSLPLMEDVSVAINIILKDRLIQ